MIVTWQQCLYHILCHAVTSWLCWRSLHVCMQTRRYLSHSHHHRWLVGVKWNCIDHNCHISLANLLFHFYYPTKWYVLLVKPTMLLLTPSNPESTVMLKVVASPQPVFICDLLTAGKSIIIISPSSELIRMLQLIPEGSVMSSWCWTITLNASD